MADQRLKCVHNVLFKWEESYINWSTVHYKTSKLRAVKLCIELNTDVVSFFSYLMKDLVNININKQVTERRYQSSFIVVLPSVRHRNGI